MIKKYYMGKRYYSFKDKVLILSVWVIKWLIRLAILSLIIFIAVTYFRYRYPSIVYTDVPVVQEVPSKAPIMDRIAQCESSNTQLAKNGQILLNANKDGSVDIGVFQINNKQWGAKATELGFNLMVEQDNRAMAQWIYLNVGTGPWYSSMKCWNR